MTLEVIWPIVLHIIQLTQQQLEFMKLLDYYEIELFKFDEIENHINRKFDNLNEVLENLVHKELLSRIEWGSFARLISVMKT